MDPGMLEGGGSMGSGMAMGQQLGDFYFLVKILGIWSKYLGEFLGIFDKIENIGKNRIGYLNEKYCPDSGLTQNCRQDF